MENAMIDDKTLSKFKSIEQFTLFLNEKINDGNEISRGKTATERSKEQKRNDNEKKYFDLRRRGYREETELDEAEKKAHDRNTKTKETEVKKHANGGSTTKTVEKEPIPDQDMEQEPEEQPEAPPPPPPVAPAPGSQVKIGRKQLKPEVEPMAKKLEVGKSEDQKIDIKPKISVKADNDYGVKK